MYSCHTMSLLRPGAPHHASRRCPQPASCSAVQLHDSAPYKLMICTHKTCKKQGSKQILKFASDLALPQVDAIECGCLGNCGNGPNAMLVAPGGRGAAPVELGHLATPARLADALRALCGADVGEATLRSTELRLAGNAAARSGDLLRAVELYTQALDLGAPSGRHLLLSNRSGALLALGDAPGALRDADAAVAGAPASFTTAAVRQADALCALGRPRDALCVLRRAAARAPDFAHAADYRKLVKSLERGT